jgi:hypothetical protein
MKTGNLFSLISTILVLGFLPFLSACTGETTNRSETVVIEDVIVKKDQLRHVVLFKFKDSATPQDIANVESAFEALPSKIPQIRSFEWGKNNSPEGLDKGFTHCFLLTFDNEDDRAVYLPHPDHKAFGAEIGQFIEDVLVVDYFTGKR